MWAGTMPTRIKTFVKTLDRENITAIVTSLGSAIKRRDGFKKVMDLVGEDIVASNDVE